MDNVYNFSTFKLFKRFQSLWPNLSFKEFTNPKENWGEFLLGIDEEIINMAIDICVTDGKEMPSLYEFDGVCTILGA